MRPAAAALLVLLFTIASPAGAQDEAAPSDDELSDPDPEVVGHHCLDEEKSKWIGHQLLGGQLNPAGIEISGRYGLCFPFITTPGPLFAYTSLEVGVVEYLSPAYGELGGYVQLTPISILQLRAELMGLAYWPFPFPRAGYYGDLTGYDADFTPDALPAEDAGSATGWNLNLFTILRLRIPLSEKLGIVALSMWSYEYFDIGDGDYYFPVRRDLIVAQSDWMIASESFVAAEYAVTDALRLRVGLYDSFRTVPASGYSANQVGLFLGAHWPVASELLKDVQPFVRFGIYTAHEFRTSEPSLLFGSLWSYDFGEI